MCFGWFFIWFSFSFSFFLLFSAEFLFVLQYKTNNFLVLSIAMPIAVTALNRGDGKAFNNKCRWSPAVKCINGNQLPFFAYGAWTV